jgi:hypothetical protein
MKVRINFTRTHLRFPNISIYFQEKSNFVRMFSFRGHGKDWIDFDGVRIIKNYRLLTKNIQQIAITRFAFW